jgi:hypothetical protein
VGAALARDLQQIRNAAVGQALDALERKRRARAVAHEPLAPLVVLGRDAHGAVHVEALERDARNLGQLVPVAGLGAAIAIGSGDVSRDGHGIREQTRLGGRGGGVVALAARGEAEGEEHVERRQAVRLAGARAGGDDDVAAEGVEGVIAGIEGGAA